MDDLLAEIEVDLWEYEPLRRPGVCNGCGQPGESFHQCLSCGGPIEPEDESAFYYFGNWYVGPCPASFEGFNWVPISEA